MLSLRLKYFRIVKEEAENGGVTYFRVQKRGWFGWYDVRFIEHFNPHGPSLTKILRYDTVEEARKFIDDKRARYESRKSIVEEHAIYGC